MSEHHVVNLSESVPVTETPTPDFRKAIEAILTDGEGEFRLRPDVQPVKLNVAASYANKEVFVTVSNLILKRLESKPPRARIQDGFPFSYLSGCLVCGDVFFNKDDPDEKCAHCPQGQSSDLYISRKEAYLLALVGRQLGLWEAWPDVDAGDEAWKDDVNRERKQLAALPLISRPTPLTQQPA